MPIEPGTKIGAYTVQEFVGRGAMGVVYRAYHEGLARPAALKVLQALAPDDEAIGRFRREAQSIGQMRHPNILQVFDFGEYESTPYMIVEYVPGGDLVDRLTRGRPADPAFAIAILKGIAAGLDYAHSRGVVHRDVKPANVLMGVGDTPILADFGLAKLLQSSSVKSMTGVTTGTPAYMAPEQATGSPVGPAADRYALATVAYELLTGSVPFQAEGVLELLYAHVHREPPAASSRNPQLGPEVDAILARGLAKAPEERWSSCAELVERLEAALTGRPLMQTQPIAAPAPAPAVAAVERTQAMPPAGPPATPPRRRRRWLALAAAAALLVIVAGAAALALNRPAQVSGSLSSGSVQAGDTVVLRADHLPANQRGNVQLASRQVDVGAFTADASGHVDETVRIPRDTTPGGHELYLCWNLACRWHTAIEVSAPAPSPTPRPTATPTPVAIARVVANPVPLVIGKPATVAGLNFPPNSRRAIVFVQAGTPHTVGEVAVDAQGAFQLQEVVPSNLAPGPAQLRACVPAAQLTDCVDTTVQVSK